MDKFKLSFKQRQLEEELSGVDEKRDELDECVKYFGSQNEVLSWQNENNLLSVKGPLKTLI